MGTVGTLECELLDRRSLRTPVEARMEAFLRDPWLGWALLHCKQRKLLTSGGEGRKKTNGFNRNTQLSTESG